MSRTISCHAPSSASRILPRIGILAVLVVAALLAGCFYYDPYGHYPPSTSSLSVTSPASSVYTSTPLLAYSAQRDVLVTLNGERVTTVSNEYLTNAVTGLNKVVVSEVDSATGDVIDPPTEITFFLNDLSSSDSENFTTDYSDWSTSTSGYGISLIFSDSFAVQGATNVNAWGSVFKAYDAGTETECIQALDVLLIKNNNAYAAVGFQGNAGEMMAAKLDKSGSSTYSLSIVEVSPQITGGSVMLDSGSLNAPTSAGTAVRVYFYRDGTAYQAVAADGSGTIITSVGVVSYASVIDTAGRLGSRGINLSPYDSAGNSTTMVAVDNYNYYK